MDLKIKEFYLSATLGNTIQREQYYYGNTDVIVLMEEVTASGEKRITKYVASFFAYKNIAELKCKHEKTGAYLNGKYFYSKNMLLIDEWSWESVRTVIEQLIEEGEFLEVFWKI